MNFLYFCLIIGRNCLARGGILNEESIVCISSWMTLGLEESIEVPEGAFNVSISWHLCKAHFQEDFSELFSHQQKRVQVTTVLLRSLSIEIVLLILGILPGSGTDHLGCEFSLKLYPFRCVLSPLSHLVSFNRLNIQMLSFFVLINGLFIMDIHTWVL